MAELFDNNPDEFVLDPKHPGLNDPEYVARRKMFFDLAREHRLHNLGIPPIEYTPEEHAMWHLISQKLKASHDAFACKLYLHGKQQLNLDSEHIPELNLLNDYLSERFNVSLTPAEGLLDSRSFFSHLAERVLPVTQFLRHGSDPKYTPEPDAVHDIIGHLPPLMEEQYCELMQILGEGVRVANDEQLLAWQRVYWFSLEFGLIEEDDEIKVFGAGLLSSFGEMEFCFSDQVERKPFDIFEVINTDYDPTVMQTKLFVIKSLSDLKRQFLALVKYFS